MCKKEVRKFCIVGLDLVLQSQKITEEIGRKKERYMFHIFNCKGDLIGNFNLSPLQGKMLFEMSVVDIKEGRTTTFFQNSCKISYPSRVKGEINTKFQEFLRAKASLDVGIEIIQNPKGSQSTYKLNCTEYTEPKTFTYSDFLDVFLSPINTVIINNKKYEKTDIDDKRKRELFFWGSIPNSADMLRYLYYVNGRNIENSPETTVDNIKQHLKQLLVAEDLFPTSLRYLLDNLPGVSEDKVLDIREENITKQNQWAESEYIFPDECYSGLSKKISEISNKIATFISSNTLSEIINNEESSRKKIDDCIVVLYFIALANYAFDDEKDDQLKITRESFLSKLNNLIARLFASDSSNPETMEISGLIAEILTKFKLEQLTVEETAKIIFELKMRKIDQNRYEYGNNIDQIDTVDETKHHGR